MDKSSMYFVQQEQQRGDASMSATLYPADDISAMSHNVPFHSKVGRKQEIIVFPCSA